MTSDHGVSLTRKDGSIRIFHLYGRQPPNRDQEITLPVDGRLCPACQRGRMLIIEVLKPAKPCRPIYETPHDAR